MPERAEGEREACPRGSAKPALGARRQPHHLGRLCPRGSAQPGLGPRRTEQGMRRTLRRRAEGPRRSSHVTRAPPLQPVRQPESCRATSSRTADARRPADADLPVGQGETTLRQIRQGRFFTHHHDDQHWPSLSAAPANTAGGPFLASSPGPFLASAWAASKSDIERRSAVPAGARRVRL